MAIGHVQTGASDGGSATQPNVTLTGAPTNGNLLIAGIAGNNAASNTLTATAGWNKIAATEVSALSANDKLCVLWKVAGAGEAANQAPATFASGVNWVCGIVEYSGCATASPVEASTANQDNDATKTTTGTADPTDGVERLLVGACIDDTNPTWSAQKFNGSTTGVNERVDRARGTNTVSLTIFDKIDAATVSGNYTAEAVSTITDNGVAAIVIILPAAGAATKAPPPRRQPWRFWTRSRVA
jgi:hypothetical protein